MLSNKATIMTVHYFDLPYGRISLFSRTICPPFTSSKIVSVAVTAAHLHSHWTRLPPTATIPQPPSACGELDGLLHASGSR